MNAGAEAALTANRELAQSGMGWLARMGRLVSGLRELAPYALIEIVLPGGSLIALSLWLYRRYTTQRPGRAAAQGVLALSNACSASTSTGFVK